jgi:D-alanyl-D-alanine carboxypeptidase (penicillin-binding protein 5/6)
VPSADNVVQVLARWDEGSVIAFVTKMNAEAKRLGLARTHYAGPSGVDPASVSTAADQVRLAQIALRDPVIADIVGMAQVRLPVAGVVYNVDADLGHGGIVGIRTGWVPQGGASLVFAATTLGLRGLEVLGAIVGARSKAPIPTVLADAEDIERAASADLRERRVVEMGERVGVLVSGYAGPVTVVTAGAATALVWCGARISFRDDIWRLGTHVSAGQHVGLLKIQVGVQRLTVPLIATTGIARPSLAWRLARL